MNSEREEAFSRALAGGALDRAFRVAYATLFEACLQTARRKLARAPEIDAEAATHEAFIRFWQALCDGNYVHEGKLEAYLHQTVRHVVIDLLRKPREATLASPAGDEEAQSPEESPDPEEVTAARERLATVRAAVDHLSARQRDVLAATIAGLSNDEIAARLALTVENVRQILHRARADLRAAVGR